MTENADRNRASSSVAPLRMREPDGSLYCRPQEIENVIAVLSGLPAREVVERFRVVDVTDAVYVPSECVLHFVRNPSVYNNDDALRDLFVILRQRVLRAVPVLARRVAGSKKLTEKAVDLEIQEVVLQKFQELLCGDRGEYDERLDFYECRFNFALARLRATARRDVRREDSHYQSTTYEDDTNEPLKEVELALAALKNPVDDEKVDFLYRSKLHAAISSLPPDERRVIELLLEELPIDSQDKEVLTIVKVVGCSEKTVRNRRDRAFEKLRDALKEEEDL
jgi:DNA-directed RNA polymerase specialized sigma24 family protein